MTVEFRPGKSSSIGSTTFPDGAEIRNMGIFTDALPSGMPTEPFKPTPFPHGPRRGRYFIKPVVIHVRSQSIVFRSQDPESEAYSIPNSTFERNGLPVFIQQEGEEHLGTLHPCLSLKQAST